MNAVRPLDTLVFMPASLCEGSEMPVRLGAESRQRADERKESVATASLGPAGTMPASSALEPIRFPCNSLNACPDLAAIRVSLGLVPGERATGLVFGDARLEEVLLLLQVDHLAHPREGVLLVGEGGIRPDRLALRLAMEG